MEGEFIQAQARLQRERDRQLEAARRQRERERAERRQAEEMEAARQQAKRERELAEERRREDEELERQANGGLWLMQVLRAVPDETALESNRVTLPASMLVALAERDALSSNAVTFELALLDEHGGVLSTTCAGVDAFTADEGTVKLPVKTALSLSKGARHLDAQTRVRVKYVVLDRHAKVTATVQPLGDGFHVDGASTVNIDLPQVLARALRSGMVISQGDFIPLRHEGKTYVLVVRKLAPEAREMLTDTELAVDLMPSENVTLAHEREAAAQTELAARQERARQRLAALAAEPAAGEADTVLLRARLPSGAVHTRRFRRAAAFGDVLEWTAGLCEAEPRQVAVVQAAPGQPQHMLGFEFASTTLAALGLGGSFFVKVSAAAAVAGDGDAAAPARQPTPANSPWALATRHAETVLDKHLEEQTGEEAPVGDETTSVDMFRLLVDAGAKPAAAGRACQNHLASLRQLKASGLLGPEADGARVVALLERFNGGVARVADQLFNEVSSADEVSRAGTTSPSRDWARELHSLGEMGLDVSDARRVVDLLESNAGDLQKVVDLLL